LCLHWHFPIFNGSICVCIAALRNSSFKITLLPPRHHLISFRSPQVAVTVTAIYRPPSSLWFPCASRVIVASRCAVTPISRSISFLARFPYGFFFLLYLFLASLPICHAVIKSSVSVHNSKFLPAQQQSSRPVYMLSSRLLSFFLPPRFVSLAFLGKGLFYARATLIRRPHYP
jgi:hypothetical protein